MIMALMTADLCVAAESAVFEISEIPRGEMAGWDWGWEQNWPRPICMELALGYRISARKAYDAGLIAEVVSDDKLMDAAMARARHLLKVPPAIVRAHRDLIRRMQPAIPTEIRELAQKYYDEHKGSEDAQEAVRSWLERRPPVYKSY